MKKNFIYAITAGLFFLSTGCNSNEPAKENEKVVTVTKTDTVVLSQGINSKGIGRFNNVQVSHPLDVAMASSGKALYEAKCMACHKLTDEKLVGPGWKGVTDRRTVDWVMNFITNTQVMLDKDLVAQAEVVTCVVRMPNQDLTDEQARQVFEFMRQNDGKN